MAPLSEESTGNSERTRSRFRRLPKRQLVWSALTLGILVATGALALWLNQGARTQTGSAIRWTTHTFQVENELYEHLAALGEAESAQRGFILTDDAAYLIPWAQASDTARRLLVSLRRLTVDNASQQRRLATLDRLMEARLDVMRTGVALMRKGQRDSVDRLVKSGLGRSLMDSIHVTVRSAVAEEDSLLQRRQFAVETALSRRFLIEELIMGIALLALALATVVWVWLRRAERIVTMCAWSKAINFEGEWMSVETYMERRFGLSITHGISPAELERLEGALDDAPVLASATQGVPPPRQVK